MSPGFLERIKANILGWSPSHPTKRVSHLMYIRGNNGYLQKVMEKPLPVKNESVAAKTRFQRQGNGLAISLNETTQS